MFLLDNTFNVRKKWCIQYNIPSSSNMLETVLCESGTSLYLARFALPSPAEMSTLSFFFWTNLDFVNKFHATEKKKTTHIEKSENKEEKYESGKTKASGNPAGQ